VLSNARKAENLLLALLPESERERWRLHLEPVEMPLGHRDGTDADVTTGAGLDGNGRWVGTRARR